MNFQFRTDVFVTFVQQLFLLVIPVCKECGKRKQELNKHTRIIWSITHIRFYHLYREHLQDLIQNIRALISWCMRMYHCWDTCQLWQTKRGTNCYHRCRFDLKPCKNKPFYSCANKGMSFRLNDSGEILHSLIQSWHIYSDVSACRDRRVFTWRRSEIHWDIESWWRWSWLQGTCLTS